MKNLQNVVKRKVQKITFNLGVSTLHVQIRFFECLLHKSYRLRIKKWQVRGSEVEVNEFRRRKKQITDRFRSEMGLLVDIRQGRAQMYVKFYSWFYMPASLHKILIHGSDCQRTFKKLDVKNIGFNGNTTLGKCREKVHCERRFAAHPV
ncbi:hypothetical protein PR048_028896, partial [Dryococelus australis]